MPKLYKFGRYSIFFWSNENNEPIHVHVCEGNAAANATKIWLTSRGGCIVAHNKSRIPNSDLLEITETVKTNFFFICNEWKKHFNVASIIFYA